MVSPPAQPARGPEPDEPSESPERCANCDAVLTGPYCAQCGQVHHELRPSFGHLFEEIVEEIAHVDAKLPTTLWLLVSRPGFLSREYFAGRRARYIGPFKIYILCSVLCFLGMAISHWVHQPSGSTTEPSAQSVAAKRPGPAVRKGGAGEVSRGNPDDQRRFMWLDLSKPEPKGGIDRLIWELLEPKLVHASPREVSAHVVHGILDYTPDAMLVLLPLFALLLRILYWRRYYVEHFVFALHLHAVGYLALLALLITPMVLSFAPLVILAAFIAYVLIAFRRFYAQGWVRTVLKAAVSMFAYVCLIGFTVAAVAIAGVVFSA